MKRILPALTLVTLAASIAAGALLLAGRSPALAQPGEAGGPGGAAPGSSVASLRSDAEKLSLRQAEMGWKTWVFGEPSEQASLYREYAHLFTKDSIAKVRAAFEAEKDPEQKRALGYFLRYLETEYIGNQTAEFLDMADDLEANEVVFVNGKQAPYRNLSGIIANEPDRKRRAEYANEEYRVFRLLNAVVLKRYFDASHRLAKELGYKDYLDLAASFRMLDIESLRATAEAFLARSEEAYLKLFDEVSPIPRSEVRRSDMGRLLANKEFDAWFTAEGLLPAAYATFDGMDLGATARGKVQVNAEPLPKKNPRAVCFPVRVPRDVRLSIKPLGGSDDYSGLFHEFGHALEYASAKTTVWEFQQLGTQAPTEGYAYMMESLPEREAWLVKRTKMPPEARRSYHRRVMFSKLYMARRYSAKVLYEIEFHRGAADPEKRYQFWLSRAYGFRLNDQEASRYLTDLDPFLYAADYLQAFYLEAMLDSYLSAHYGKAWWENKEAGAFLAGLWQDANRMTAPEIAAKMGFTGYDPKTLLDYVTKE